MASATQVLAPISDVQATVILQKLMDDQVEVIATFLGGSCGESHLKGTLALRENRVLITGADNSTITFQTVGAAYLHRINNSDNVLGIVQPEGERRVGALTLKFHL